MAYNNLSKISPTEKKATILETITPYSKYWYLFLISILVCLSIGFIYLTISTPKYLISSTLLIQEDKEGEGVLKGTAFSDLAIFNTSKTVDNEIEVLRSKSLLEKVFKTLNLETSYFVDQQFTKSELYGSSLPIKVIVQKLGSNAFDKSINISVIDSKSFKLNDGSGSHTYKFGQKILNSDYIIRVMPGPAFTNSSEVAFQFNNLRNMAESYSNSKLVITPIKIEANTIILSFKDAIPERGVDILTTLIEIYNKRNVEDKNKLALNTINFIDNRLKFLSTDLSTVEQDVEQYKQENRVTDVNADAQQNLQKAGQYDQELASSEIQINVLQSIESYLNAQGSQFELVPSTLGLQDATLVGLITKFNELQLERQRLLRTAEPGNPLVLNINDQLSSLKSNIRENLRNIKRGLQITRNNLMSNSSQFASRIRTAPSIERGLQERNREQGVKESLYHYLLQKREETTLSLSATIPTSQVIDPPNYASAPVEPKKSFIYLYSFLLGLIIPALGIYTKNLLNNKVQHINDVESVTNGLILGELCHKPDNETLVIKKDSRTTISELFRYIRSNLSFANMDNANKVLLITSSMKGEGKTFFSINLAATLSLVDKKVVVLEFDLRKPDLLRSVKLKSQVGITTYINSEKVTIDDIIIPSDISPNLSIIGCGPMPENPAEALMSHRIPELFEELKNRFDYVIIDTSPVGQVADAFTLAPYADASIYLVRFNHTNKYQLNILQDIFENRKLKNPMIVLNDAKKENLKAYGYSGVYDYGYSEAHA